MTAEQLTSLAFAKFGADWELRLALRMGVSQRSVQRWARGEAVITPRVESHVRAVCNGGEGNGVSKVSDALP